MAKPRGGKEAPTPSHNMIVVDETRVHRQHHLLSKAASTFLWLTERQMSRAVVIPASNIQLRTVYITTLGTNGADCTRKPERLLPERARRATPPMAGLVYAVQVEALCRMKELPALLEKEKGCPTEERPETSRSGLGRQSGTANSLVTEREKAHNQVGVNDPRNLAAAL
ncbi:hypothetical protein GE21DRAFT_4793 [Neurospora crassa]|uniref:Uncharacterized protein n=1 Tax=Neurospora crassa (strain ATCC 24698 / 74-OR23-1A / CBS 708.71 / DSM 1257 / FGSC 987) TaxID=367110 RepID=Q7RXY3_NEUCR|nr:hypothetical protein NCU00462 [Neurospora crassa OR74A]EAA27545.3 hypothetical protein NCU00462 [Neurospora crassa OR74A]KHE87942.1 hypothetical protein GE21DRAFT_4793 [Neurospora crassa]|eukprot:XP_956781.3 hypothetical protein NCU00462 [Neurospora crassa OR74A]